MTRGLYQYLERNGDSAVVLRYEGVEAGGETCRMDAAILEAHEIRLDDFFGVDDDGNIVVSVSSVSGEEQAEMPVASFGDGDISALKAKLRQLAGEASSHDDHGGGD